MGKIAILGSGGFGTALAVTMHNAGHDILLWSVYEDEIQDIMANAENKKYLPGISIDSSIYLTSNITDIKASEYIIFAVPSFAVRSVAKLAAPHVHKDAILVNVGKGVENGTLKRLSTVISEEIPNHKFVALSGPSHAEEIARGVETAVVAASDDMQAAKKVQTVLSSQHIRIYESDDVIGVELGGAFKNVIALCVGIAYGLSVGDNSIAALETRGLAEISRLGVAMGGRAETFFGLSGLGDLIVTCTSMHSRNRRAGMMIGQGIPPAEAIERVGSVVEGYSATKTAYELAQKYGVKMPITEILYKVLYQEHDVRTCIHELMARPMRKEKL